MTTIKSLLTLILFSCFVSTSFAQLGSISISKRLATAKAEAAAAAKKAANQSNEGPQKVITANNMVYILSVDGQKAGWRRPRPNEIATRKKQKAEFLYELNLQPTRTVGGRGGDIVRKPIPVPFHNLTEHKEGLDEDIVKYLEEKGPKAKITKASVHYFKNIDLGQISFMPYMDFIIVTDTLFVPVADAGHAMLFGGYQNQGIQNIKIVANCIVFESPITLASSSAVNTSFAFSANKYIYKSVHKGLGQKIGNVPLYYKTDRNVSGSINSIGSDENKLLGNLYFESMMQVLNKLNNSNLTEELNEQLLAEYQQYKQHELSNKLLTKANKDKLAEKEALAMNWINANKLKKIITNLNATSDVWKADQLLEDFQNIRKNQINEELLEKDEKTNEVFDESCKDFHVQYGSKGVQELRKESNLMILVNGEIENLHERPFKYYTLPTKASLIPVSNQTTGKPTALGFITYYPTGESKLELEMEVALSFDQAALAKATKTLKENGLHLEQKFPVGLASIDEQPLKINGKTVGKIIPIGNQNVRFEIKLEEEGLTLFQLFTGAINFKIDYKIDGHLQPYSQHINLEINPSLLENMTQGEILESFSVTEMSKMEDFVRISSQLDAGQDNEGALNFVEVTLEFSFQNKTVFWGPRRFSS